MKLIDFDGYITFIAFFNFAYAWFKKFRSLINQDFLKIMTNVQPDIDRAVESIKSFNLLLNVQTALGIGDLYQDHINDYEKKIDSIKVKLELNIRFKGTFQTVFLFTVFYCIVLLALAGFQTILDPPVFNTAFSIVNISLLYSILLFLISFTKFRSEQIGVKTPTVIILIVVTLLYISVNSNNRLEIFQPNTNIQIMLFGILSPYLLLASRFYLHKYYYKWKVEIVHLKCIKNLTKYKEAVSYLTKIKLPDSPKPIVKFLTWFL